MYNVKYNKISSHFNLTDDQDMYHKHFNGSFMFIIPLL